MNVYKNIQNIFLLGRWKEMTRIPETLSEMAQDLYEIGVFDKTTLQHFEPTLKRTFTLEYWQDDGWYVGRLKEVPGVFSQGETLEELEENIKDAYKLIIKDEPKVNRPYLETKDVLIEVA